MDILEREYTNTLREYTNTFDEIFRKIYMIDNLCDAVDQGYELVEGALNSQSITVRIEDAPITDEVEYWTTWVESSAEQIEAEVADLRILQTIGFEEIERGMQLAITLQNRNSQNYWNIARERFLDDFNERIERASRQAIDARNTANETRRIATNFFNFIGIRNTEVDRMMVSTLEQVATFNKLYEDYENACTTLGITPKPIPEHYICPLSLQIMIEPVSADSFNSYENAFILQWLLTKTSDPLTRNPINASMFVTNTSLKNAINEFRNELTMTIFSSIPEGRGGKLRSLTRKVKSKQTKRRRYKNKYSKRRR
jgi:hypothetical protein